jgi:hypothetical protein
MFVYASVALQACNRPTLEEEYKQIAHARSTVTVYAAQTKHSNSRPGLSISWPLGNADTHVLGTRVPFSVNLPSSLLAKLVLCRQACNWQMVEQAPPPLESAIRFIMAVRKRKRESAYVSARAEGNAVSPAAAPSAPPGSAHSAPLPAGSLRRSASANHTGVPPSSRLC